MADSAEVSGCNGITKGCIVKAIKEKGLFTLDEVKKLIPRRLPCGSKLDGWLNKFCFNHWWCLFPAASEPKTGLCLYRSLAKVVRDAIREQHLISKEAVSKVHAMENPERL